MFKLITFIVITAMLVDPNDNQTGQAMESNSLVNQAVPSLLMDFYPFTAGPNTNTLEFLRAAILSLQMILVVSAVLSWRWQCC